MTKRSAYGSFRFGVPTPGHGSPAGSRCAGTAQSDGSCAFCSRIGTDCNRIHFFCFGAVANGNCIKPVCFSAAANSNSTFANCFSIYACCKGIRASSSVTIVIARSRVCRIHTVKMHFSATATGCNCCFQLRHVDCVCISPACSHIGNLTGNLLSRISICIFLITYRNSAGRRFPGSQHLISISNSGRILGSLSSSNCSLSCINIILSSGSWIVARYSELAAGYRISPQRNARFNINL